VASQFRVWTVFVPATFGRLVHHGPLSWMVPLACNNVSDYQFILFYGLRSGNSLSVGGLTSVDLFPLPALSSFDTSDFYEVAIFSEST
jgi:hypothetical protein